MQLLLVIGIQAQLHNLEQQVITEETAKTNDYYLI
jgi:hypothetical protein